MNSLAIGLISAGCIFGGTLFGLILQRLIPNHQLSKESHDMVKLGAGMIGTMSALVLGLMVSSAKSSFDTMNTGIIQGSAKVILLDRDLLHYGPEAAKARLILRANIERMLANVWPEELSLPESTPFKLKDLQKTDGMELVQEELRNLAPKTDAQRLLLNQSLQLATEVSQIRWMIVEQAHNSIPTTFLVVLISWLTVLFVTFGIFAPRNATVITTLFICALSVSAAIFLVLELNHSLTGIIKVSGAPMHNALELLGK